MVYQGEGWIEYKIEDIMFRMIAFRHPLPVNGQKQLKEVLTRRFQKIAKRLREFQLLSFKDKEKVMTTIINKTTN